MARVGIFGAGTWGTALARMLSNSGHDVQVWSASPDTVEEMTRTRRHRKLPNVVIPSSVAYTQEFSEICRNKDLLIMAVSSTYVRQTTRKAAPFVKEGQIIACASKGIESKTLMTMSDVISDELWRTARVSAPVAALSGPTHAEEVAMDMPSTIVSACGDIAVAEYVQDVCTSRCMRVYTNIDIKGVELCGALKNIIALASGISSGLGYGDNARAAIITRGLAEIESLGLKMGCLEQTFSGLAGIGDLVVTATSKHSRNNRCGYLIGQGYKPAEAVSRVGMVVEGIHALPAAMELAGKYGVEMPIVCAVNEIISNSANALEVVNGLMGRDMKTELPKPVLDIAFEKAVVQNAAIWNKGERGMKRVITYGTFDLLHYGHINLLRRAKALGDYLIVALSTDEFNWNEKQKKCYFSYEQRKMLLESIRYVDLVIPEENWEQKRNDIHEYHIDTFVMGNDWEGKFDFLREEGAEVVYLPRTPEISTTQIKSDLHT